MIRSLLFFGGVVSIPIAISEAAVIAEIEFNDSLATAQDVGAGFSTGANREIGSQWGIDPVVTPWVSITSSGGRGFDYFSFTTRAPGDISLDIDHGISLDGIGSVDTELGLWRRNGDGSFALLGNNDDWSITWNVGDDSPLDPGTVFSWDAGLRFLGLPAGDYVAGVGRFAVDFDDSGMSPFLAGNVMDDSDSYTLQITASGRRIPDTGSSLLLFSASAAGLLLGHRALRRRSL